MNYETRRQREYWVLQRQIRIHKDSWHPPRSEKGAQPLKVVTRWCDEPNRFRKNRALACHCSKKALGQPKIGKGCCYIGDYRHSVRARQEWELELRRLLDEV